MLVAVYCLDADGSDAPRQAQKEAHFAHIRKIKPKIKVAGPLLAEDGQAVSSLLVFEADSLEEAEEWMRQDPYYQAGVWKETRVLRFRAVVGDWAGADAVL